MHPARARQHQGTTRAPCTPHAHRTAPCVRLPQHSASAHGPDHRTHEHPHYLDSTRVAQRCKTRACMPCLRSGRFGGGGGGGAVPTGTRRCGEVCVSNNMSVKKGKQSAFSTTCAKQTHDSPQAWHSTGPAPARARSCTRGLSPTHAGQFWLSLQPTNSQSWREARRGMAAQRGDLAGTRARTDTQAAAATKGCRASAAQAAAAGKEQTRVFVGVCVCLSHTHQCAHATWDLVGSVGARAGRVSGRSATTYSTIRWEHNNAAAHSSRAGPKPSAEKEPGSKQCCADSTAKHTSRHWHAHTHTNSDDR
jgi:hypothetical protein